MITDVRSVSDEQLSNLKYLLSQEQNRRERERIYIDDPLLARAEALGYADGYRCGLTWPDKWDTHGKPGGPWVFKSDDKKRAHRSLRHNEKWREGWADGHAIKVLEKRSYTVEAHRDLNPCGPNLEEGLV